MYWRLLFSIAFGVGAVIFWDHFLWSLPWWGYALVFLMIVGGMHQNLERDAANRYLAQKGDDYEKGRDD